MDYTIYILVAPYLSLVLAFFLVLVGRRWRMPGARGLFWLVLSALGYLIANYLELVLSFEPAKILSGKFSNVFVSVLPVTWLIFVFDFIGRTQWRRLEKLWPVFIPSVAFVVLMFTNESHHLIWSAVRFVPVGAAVALQVDHGSLYNVFMVLLYAIFLAGIVLIVREFARGRDTYRRQLFWIILGTAVAMAVNMIYVFRIFPWLRKDYSPFGFAAGGVLYAVGIFRHRFLDLAPASRSRLFEALQDGIVVLDDALRIIDMNATAKSILDLGESELGTSLSTRTFLLPLLQAPLDANGRAEQDVVMEISGRQSHFAAILSRVSLETGGRCLFILVLHDVTERMRLLQEIRTLRGIVPICASCKKVRTDKGYWQSVEAYVAAHSYAEFSHSLCPECLNRLYPEPREG